MNWKYLFAVTLILALRPGLAGGPLKIVTTTQDLSAIAEAVGGDHVKADFLTPGTRDPHYAEAKPSMIRQVARADLLILVGAELEVGWLPALLASARNSRIQPGTQGYLDLSTSIQLLDVPTGPVTRAMGDVHPLGNPHYWLDPQNGIQMARAVAQQISALDTEHAADFGANLERFEATMAEKIAEWQDRTRALRGLSILTYHTSFTYLARAFGMSIVDQIEPKPGISPSASHLNQLVARIKADHIPLILMEPFYDQRPASFLAEQTGIHVAVIPQSVGAFPEIRNYPDLFDAISKALVEAYGGGTHE